MYADDFKIYKFGSPKDHILTIKQLNSDLEKNQIWTKNNNLYLNAKRSQPIIICRRNGIVDRLRIKNEINNIIINKTEISYIYHI